MISPEELCHKPCQKIDAGCVNAFVGLSLDPLDPKKIVLESSWGNSSVDITNAVKASETMTYLKLSPVNDPEYLEYIGEDGEPQCIDGEDLARIVTFLKLKDIDQETAPSDGDVYIYDGEAHILKPYQLVSVINNLTERIEELEETVEAQGTTINSLSTAIAQIQLALAKPEGIPADARIVWGNRNVYADNTNADLKAHGLFSHNTSVDFADDMKFA